MQRNNINSEDSTYTYILLTDQAFLAEKNKLQRFYQTSSLDSTDSLVKYHVIKDLAFKGVLDQVNFPAAAYSVKDSVRFRLNKDAIVETHYMSNGIIYVMNSLDYDLYSSASENYGKLKAITVQGESYADYAPGAGSSVSRSIRTRRNPFTGQLYRDLLVSNTGVRNYWYNYLLTNVNSAKYQVYGVAVNDFQSATFPQKIAFSSPIATDFIPLTTVPTTLNLSAPPTEDTYKEKQLGEFTFTKYYTNPSINMPTATPLSMYLIGNNSTTNGANTLVLDYVKLVPIP